MLSLQELSKIGFGCHHANIDNREHLEGLLYAIEKGCNLIDTSSNYQNGKSELLVGEALKMMKKKPCFVMTKGGNISLDNLKEFNKVKTINIEQVVKIGENAFHCIQPDYLDVQLKVSHKRLQRTCIDGYFLHNPEYYLLNGENAQEQIYYERLKKAFEYLEDQVEQGKIRYYGISESSGLTDMSRLVQIAESVSSSNHFKLLQFPFNILEKGVTQTVLEITKQKNMITFGNRPLTIRKNNKTYRLIKYKHAVDETSVLTAMDDVFTEIEKQIRKKKMNLELTDVYIIKYIYLQWNAFDNDAFFCDLFEIHFMSFISDLFDHKISVPFQQMLKKFEAQLKKYIQNKMYVESKAFLADLGFSTLLNSKNVSKKVCQLYLKEGIDHVLLGMRNRAYVDSVTSVL